jgi:predicted nucleic acid-binding protein
MREFLRTIQYKYFAVRKQQIRDLKLKIRDNRDQKILGGAIVSRCDILITGDKDFFEHRYKGIEIMTPADFIKKYCSINQL